MQGGIQCRKECRFWRKFQRNGKRIGRDSPQFGGIFFGANQPVVLIQLAGVAIKIVVIWQRNRFNNWHAAFAQHGKKRFGLRDSGKGGEGLLGLCQIGQRHAATVWGDGVIS